MSIIIWFWIWNSQVEIFKGYFKIKLRRWIFNATLLKVYLTRARSDFTFTDEIPDDTNELYRVIYVGPIYSQYAIWLMRMRHEYGIGWYLFWIILYLARYVGERLHCQVNDYTHARNVPAEFVELSVGVCTDFSFADTCASRSERSLRQSTMDDRFHFRSSAPAGIIPIIRPCRA